MRKARNRFKAQATVFMNTSGRAVTALFRLVVLSFAALGELVAEKGLVIDTLLFTQDPKPEVETTSTGVIDDGLRQCIRTTTNTDLVRKTSKLTL